MLLTIVNRIVQCIVSLVIKVFCSGSSSKQDLKHGSISVLCGMHERGSTSMCQIGKDTYIHVVI